MAKSKGSSSGAAVTDLKKGLTNRSAAASDASMKPKGASVNAGSTRSTVAKSHSLGGRVA